MNRDDPNLTAYALGETGLLSATERRAIERLLEESAEARAFVAETAAFAEMLQGEFRKELSGAALPPAARARLLGQGTPAGARGVLARFPGARRTAWVAGLGALAAAIAVAFWLPFAATVTPGRGGSVASGPESAREEAGDGLTGGRAVARSGEPPVDGGQMWGDEVLREDALPRSSPVPAGAPSEEAKAKTAMAPVIAPATRDARYLAKVETGAGSDFGSGIELGVGGGSVQRGAEFNLKIAPEIERGPGKEEAEAKLNADRQRPVGSDGPVGLGGVTGFVAAAQNPSSGFLVGPASSSTVRRLLDARRQPPAGAVRLGEWLDYFYAAQPPPGEGRAPFVRVEVGECPWAPAHRLVWIGSSGEGAAERDGSRAGRAEVALRVEFNPRAVGAYRLIGEENRPVAGTIRTRRAMTALYEVIPLPASGKGLEEKPRQLLTVTLRHEKAESGSARVLVEKPVADRGTPLAESSPDFRFAAAVAEFWILLENPGRAGGATWASVRELALHGKGSDPDGRRAAFLRLLEKTPGQPGGEATPLPGRE